jgi:protein-disulfide isomerase
MNQTATSLRSPVLIAGAVLLLLLGGVAGWLGSQARMERVVHDYVLDHPEILPQAMDNLRRREDASQLAGVRATVETPFPGAVLGNPKGKVTLVEFADFACTFCRRSVADVEALIAANPELKVVVREFPILSPQSADAAKMALAAAEQGKYPAFHKAMYELGRPSPQTIEAAAKTAGLDMDRARKTLADPKLEAELRQNLEIARQLGFQGTPSWVIGDRLLSGAVGKDKLAAAIAEARS